MSDRDIEQAADQAAATDPVPAPRHCPECGHHADYHGVGFVPCAAAGSCGCLVPRPSIRGHSQAAATDPVPAQAVEVAYKVWWRAHSYAAEKDDKQCLVDALAAAAPLIVADRAMYEIAYWAVEKVLDEALGTEEEDGSGGGIAAEVYLLMEQRNQARAEVARLTAERDAARARMEIVYEATISEANLAGQVEGEMIRRLLKGIGGGTSGGETDG
jgi:hypothetical protein